MAIEIERKFLIKNASWREISNAGIEIKQGYLNSNIDRTVRIRIIGSVGLITVKCKTINMTRKEFEYQIPVEDAIELLELCEKPIIEKIRFEIIQNNKTWEIDEFKGVNAGLIIAEIELENEAEKIRLPEWIGKEVTLEAKYYNSNLIENPYTNWKED